MIRRWLPANSSIRHSPKLQNTPRAWRGLPLYIAISHPNSAGRFRLRILVARYAATAKRISGSSWADPDIVLAQKLLDWLLRDWAKPVSARDIYLRAQHRLRSRDHLAGQILVDTFGLNHTKPRHDMREWQIIRGTNQ